MGETDEHRDVMFRNIELLKTYYDGQQVYVTGDLLLYYQQGDPKKFVVPDAFIVKGKPQVQKRTYKLWVERIVPQLVIETTSKKTKKKDLHVKPAIYAQIGVHEYFLFDPTCDYLDPPLQGHRLVDGSYQAIPIEPTGCLYSEELDLELRFENSLLNFYKRGTNDRLRTQAELRQRESEARQRESEARQRESEARRLVELDNARLREELAKLKGESQDQSKQ